MELIPLLYLLFGATFAQEIRPGVVNVPEGGHALLPCGLDSGQSIDEFDWRKDDGEKEKKEVFMYDRGSYYGYNRKGQDDQFKDRVEFFQHELKFGNASIIIKNTRLEDNGTYTCGLGLHEPYRKEINLRLNVAGVLKTRINVTGAARVPYIKTIRDEITWRLLECKAHGDPQPEVEWRNSAGEVLVKYKPKSEDGRSDVEVIWNVSKSDNYTCVATQWTIFHQINNTLEVGIPDSLAVVEGDDAVLPCFLGRNIKDIEFSWRKDNEEVFLYRKGQVEKNKQFSGRLTYFQQELKSGNASIKIHSTKKSDIGRYTCYFPSVQKSHVVLNVAGQKTDSETPTKWIAAVVGLAVVIVLLLVLGFFIIRRKGSSGRPSVP